MSQPAAKPLNPKQKAFARELGVALASGDRTFEGAYVKAGYRRNRGNAARLATDPRVRIIADEAAAEALKHSGLHLAYLQAKLLEMVHANVYDVHRKVAMALRRPEGEMTLAEEAALLAATWPLSEMAVDKDGALRVKLPDKKQLIETVLKTMPGGLAPTKHAMTDSEGQDLPAPALSPHEAARHLAYALFNLPEGEKPAQ